MVKPNTITERIQLLQALTASRGRHSQQEPNNCVSGPGNTGIGNIPVVTCDGCHIRTLFIPFATHDHSKQRFQAGLPATVLMCITSFSPSLSTSCQPTRALQPSDNEGVQTGTCIDARTSNSPISCHMVANGLTWEPGEWLNKYRCVHQQTPPT